MRTVKINRLDVEITVHPVPVRSCCDDSYTENYNFKMLKSVELTEKLACWWWCPVRTMTMRFVIAGKGEQPLLLPISVRLSRSHCQLARNDQVEQIVMKQAGKDVGFLVK
jgi:hypothetical protein